jgi:hypothetical protein
MGSRCPKAGVLENRMRTGNPQDCDERIETNASEMTVPDATHEWLRGSQASAFSRSRIDSVSSSADRTGR